MGVSNGRGTSFTAGVMFRDGVSASAGVQDLARRMFIKLNGTDAFYTIENPITYAGDFSIKFELSSQPQADAKLISLKMPGSGKFTVSTDDGAPFTKIKITMADTTGVTLPSTIDTQNGKLNRCLITFNETTRLLSFFVNEQAAGSLTAAATAVPDFSATTGTEVGKEVGFNGNFTGIIANVDFGNGNAWKLGNPTGNTEQAANGNNLLTYVNIDADARELLTFIKGRWVGEKAADITDYTFTGVESLGTIDSVSGVVTGFNYQWSYDLNIVNPVAGLFRLRIGGVIVGGDQSITGTFSGDHLAVSGTTFATQVLNSNITAGSTYKNVLIERFIEVA